MTTVRATCATGWDLAGAIDASAGIGEAEPARAALLRFFPYPLPDSLIQFNDAAGRTRDDVLELIDRAIGVTEEDDRGPA